MEGDVAPLAEYAALCRSAGAMLIVDEAHAVGVYGGRGSGLIEAAGIDHASLRIGQHGREGARRRGAFVAGPAWAIEYLLQRARPFVFSTAPPPAFAEAIDASLDLIEQEPERRARVLQLAAYIRRALAEPEYPDGSRHVTDRACAGG